MRRVITGLYGFALISILGLTGYHFVLPEQLNWDAQMANATPMMQWALDLLNFDWSLTAFLFAVTLLVFLRKPTVAASTKRFANNMFCLFWVGHALHLYLFPPYVPPQLSWIPLVMLAFPVLTLSMLLLGNIVFKEEAKA